MYMREWAKKIKWYERRNRKWEKETDFIIFYPFWPSKSSFLHRNASLRGLKNYANQQFFPTKRASKSSVSTRSHPSWPFSISFLFPSPVLFLYYPTPCNFNFVRFDLIECHVTHRHFVPKSVFNVAKEWIKINASIKWPTNKFDPWYYFFVAQFSPRTKIY